MKPAEFYGASLFLMAYIDKTSWRVYMAIFVLVMFFAHLALDLYAGYLERKLEKLRSDDK
jgi:hypothetical protein